MEVMCEAAFKSLEAHWRELYDQYEAVKASIAPIERWEWTDRERYDVRPYYFQRSPVRGRVLRKPPTTDRAKQFRYEYGFDAQGQVVMCRYTTGLYTWETFYTYTPEEFTEMTFTQRQGRWLLNVIAQAVMKSGRMQSYVSLKTDYNYIDRSQPFPAAGQVEMYHGEGLESATADQIWARLAEQQYAIEWQYESYFYQRRRLTLIQTQHNLPRFRDWEWKDSFAYDEKGRVAKVSRALDGRFAKVLYRRRKPGETLASLTEAAKRKLVEAIPKVVAAAKLKEPLYCLNLYYFLAKTGDYFPPRLLLGFERDRQRKMEKYPRKKVYAHIWWYLWDGDEPEHVPYEPLEITDPDTLEACEALEVEINMRWQSPIAVRTLYQIARELNQLDWSQFTPVTPDFIVYACDQTEHVKPPQSLRRSGATKEQLKDWRKRGMVYSRG